MQMSGKDIEHGFHLGIVPFFLDDDPPTTSPKNSAPRYSKAVNGMLADDAGQRGVEKSGVITAIVDESAGADQFWGRDIETQRS